MISVIALIAILLAANYLLMLALISHLNPDKTSAFLLGFASSAFLHYLELFIRILIGIAFVVRAPLMKFQELFSAFGWMLIGTSVCLLLIPWHWHRKFSAWAVPYALRNLKPIAICSFALGSLIIFAILPANGS